ncbi:hypothetical protein Mapa_013608 [Marchantia paleacea]|nr:hypothetical protein Mapa_013608 [Marchantia paleacea]
MLRHSHRRLQLLLTYELADPTRSNQSPRLRSCQLIDSQHGPVMYVLRKFS